MKKSIAILLIALSFASCKTAQKAVVAEGSAAEAKGVKEVIEGHYANPKEFSTLLIKASADYSGDKNSLSANAEIRLISVKAVGFTMAKAIITPTRVSYYEKIKNTYFDGNYEALSRWLGTELDYAKVQNMLLGDALYDLSKGKYTASVEGGQHKLKSADRSAITKLFFFEGAKFLLKKETISEAGTEPRNLEISYPAHKEYPKGILPASIKIEAEQTKDRVNLSIDYKSVVFDEKLTFPYEVPEGYEQIFID